MELRKLSNLFKIVLDGSSNAGKSTFLNAATDLQLVLDIKPTIGVDFKCTYFDLDNNATKITLWDTAGLEKFKTLVSSYYRGINAIIFVVDIRNYESPDELVECIKNASIHLPQKCLCSLLIANYQGKCDDNVIDKLCGTIKNVTGIHMMLFRKRRITADNVSASKNVLFKITKELIRLNNDGWNTKDQVDQTNQEVNQIFTEEDARYAKLKFTHENMLWQYEKNQRELTTLNSAYNELQQKFKNEQPAKILNTEHLTLQLENSTLQLENTKLQTELDKITGKIDFKTSIFTFIVDSITCVLCLLILGFMSFYFLRSSINILNIN